MIAVILAAGKGTRMKSEAPKALAMLAGRPMVEHVLGLAEQAGASRRLVVVGYRAQAVQAALPSEEVVIQEPQLGTGHALLCCRENLKDFRGDLLVLYVDTPLLRPENLRALIRRHRETGAAATLLTVRRADPAHYGRIVRDAAGRVLAVVEARDATPEQLAIREINVGTYCVRMPLILRLLEDLEPENSQRELYLTDAVRLLAARGERVEAVEMADEQEAMGVNDRQELALAERILGERQAATGNREKKLKGERFPRRKIDEKIGIDC